MRRKPNHAMALGAVLGLLIFASGCQLATGASVPRETGTPPSSHAAQVTATQVVVYQPVAPTGAEHQGACFTSSLAAPRSGVWRCSITDHVKGANLFDPCFALAAGESHSVICGANPVTGDQGFKVVLTTPLPPAQIASPSHQGWGWIVQLEDGTVCTFITGATFAIEGARGNYSCVGGDWILGDLTLGTVWTAQKASVTNQGDVFSIHKSQTIALRTVWQ